MLINKLTNELLFHHFNVMIKQPVTCLDSLVSTVKSSQTFMKKVLQLNSTKCNFFATNFQVFLCARVEERELGLFASFPISLEGPKWVVETDEKSSFTAQVSMYVVSLQSMVLFTFCT